MVVEKIRVYKGSRELSYKRLQVIFTEDEIVDRAFVWIEPSSSISNGDTIDLNKVDGTTGIFSGKIVDIVNEDVWKLIIMGPGHELNTTNMLQVYTNKSPEFIVSDIIANQTVGLTDTTTVSSGVTLENYVAKGYLIDIIKDMMFILQWQLVIDSSGNATFEPKGETNNGVTFTNGVNIQISKWHDDSIPMINQVRIVAGLINVKAATEEFNGDGDNKTFTLTKKPVGDVLVTVGGTRKTPGVDGTQDYEVDAENKQIVFVAAPVSGTNNVDVDYNFQMKVVVEDQDDDSISDHQIKFKEFQAPFITTFLDARKMAAGILQEHSKPVVRPVGKIPGFHFGIGVGETVVVNDPSRNKSATVIIKSIIHDTSGFSTKMVAGRREASSTDFDTEVKERIKKLERRTADDEVTAQARLSKHKMAIKMKEETFFEYSCLVDSFVLGHQTLGRLRANLNYEADCSDQANHGTWQGSDIAGSQYATNGFRLSAGNFNGSDNYITIPNDSDLNTTSDFTIALAVRVETLPGSETYILNKYDGTDGYAVRINASDKVELIYSNGGSDTVFAASTALTAKTYQHVVFVKSGTSLTVYVNSSSDNTATESATVGTNSNAFEVGRYSANYFTGKLDEVRFYNNNISSSDVTALFNQTRDVLTDCKLWMSMDNPRLGDRSGRRHTVSIDSFLETFRQKTFQGSPFTADWDTGTRRLRMSSNPKRSRAYQSIAHSIAYGCQGRSFATVTVSAVEHRWGKDIIKYYISTDGSTWNEVTFGQSFSIPAAQYDNNLYWRVIFLGNGGTDTYITNLKLAYTLV